MVRIKNVILILGVLSVFLLGKDARAVALRQINLEEMVTTAQHIFSGTCITVERKYDDTTNRDAIFCRFSISKMIKGEALSELTFKMSTVAVDLGQAPTFNPGEEVVLFLYGKSTLGFTSPVGLGSGKFSVLYLPAGEKAVVNAHNNTNLFKDIDSTKYSGSFSASYATEINSIMSKKSGAINYHLFLTLLEEMVN
jgi:hypothetical protein